VNGGRGKKKIKEPETDHLEDLDLDGRTVLRWVLKEWVRKAWSA
jgi:hypothetical protein